MIFTGIEILFFALGVLTTLFILALIHYNKRFRFSILHWILLCTGGFLLLFCIAWAVSSVLEGVPRAASMGLVVFGVSGFIILFLARRLILKRGEVEIVYEEVEE